MCKICEFLERLCKLNKNGDGDIDKKDFLDFLNRNMCCYRSKTTVLDEELGKDAVYTKVYAINVCNMCISTVFIEYMIVHDKCIMVRDFKKLVLTDDFSNDKQFIVKKFFPDDVSKAQEEIKVIITDSIRSILASKSDRRGFSED